MPRDHVVGEQAQRLDVAARGEELEGADADVARGHARQHRAGQRRLAHTRARRWSRRRARAWSGCRAPHIASLTRYSRSTGPSAARPSPRRENGVGPEPLSWMSRRTPRDVDDLAQQDRAAVAELRHEVAELVAGIGQRDRLGALGQPVAGEDLDALGRRQRVRVEAELRGERPVELGSAAAPRRASAQPGVEPIGQAGVAVVERPARGIGRGRAGQRHLVGHGHSVI